MNENSQSAPTIKSWLESASRELEAATIPSARLDAELLLSHTLRKPRSWLHAHIDETLDPRTREIARARLDLRLDRVPVAYIIGHKEFYGRPFKVTTATLIPRPETEDLLELVTQALPKNNSLLNETTRVVDVGTGSGNLGITIKLEHPELDVTIIDKSRHALNIAEDNAKALQASVTALHGDLLAPYPFRAHLIVANLPYVDESWERSPETEHEPASALFADHGGLALIYQLLLQTKQKLFVGGSIILEADPEQHAAIIKKAASYGLVHQATEGYGLLLNKLK